MSDLATIVQILTGKKVRVGNTWKVYDASDNEIVDTGGVLWRGVHGVLLMWPRGGAPSRSHKEEKKHYRDKGIDWTSSFDDLIKDKKKEIKEVKKQITSVKKIKSVLVNEKDIAGFNKELNELLELLEQLLKELDVLETDKLVFKAIPRSDRKEIFKEVDDFEDLLIILKFVLRII